MCNTLKINQLMHDPGDMWIFSPLLAETADSKQLSGAGGGLSLSFRVPGFGDRVLFTRLKGKGVLNPVIGF
jgi:hypothetical protein